MEGTILLLIIMERLVQARVAVIIYSPFGHDDQYGGTVSP
jgi:hypothetical protein